MGRTIGIDLGTTNSAVAFVQQDRVETILNTEGSKTTPSMVLFGDGEIIVGELAKRQVVTHGGQVVRSAKRLIGQRYSELAYLKDRLPFRFEEGENDRPEIILEDGRAIPPELVSSQILQKMVDTAEDFLGEDIDGAVITVPAHFNDSQRTATKKAAELIGLNVLRIINEPTAAALAFGLGKEDRKESLAVFDFGGGTFDISIVSIEGDIFEVLSTNGDNHLGGDNIDEVLIDYLCEEVREATGIDPRSDMTSLARIRETAEKTKIELSNLSKTVVSLPFIVSDDSGPKHYEGNLTREKFEELIDPILQALLEPCRMVMEDSRLSVSQITEVILVGGSTRIPKVQQLVEQFFARKPNRSVNPDEAVAMGAAIQAGVMRGELAELLLLDVTPLSLGIELAGGVFKPLIERNSSIPCEAARKYTTVIDNQSTVTVHVLQGERPVAHENRTLARFRLMGIPPMPKELPEIEVNFRIDADGILEVSAVDLTSGVSAGVQVEGYGDMAAVDESEVNRILAEVKEYREKDEDFVRSAAKRMTAQRLSNRADRLLEVGSNLLEENELKRLKEAMIRLDLAVAASEWMIADQHGESLQEILEKCEKKYEISTEPPTTASGEYAVDDDFQIEGLPEELSLPTSFKEERASAHDDAIEPEAPSAVENDHGEAFDPEAAYADTQVPTSPSRPETSQEAEPSSPADAPSGGGQLPTPPVNQGPIVSGDRIEDDDEDAPAPPPIPRHQRPLVETDEEGFDFDDDFGAPPPPPPPK